MKEGFKRTAKMKIDNKVFTGAAAEKLLVWETIM